MSTATETKPIPANAIGGRFLLTGSRVYGTPRPDSDIDLVLHLSPQALNLLCDALPEENGDKKEPYPEDEGIRAVLRVGSLNLLLVTHPADFEAWESGTEELIAARPVTRAHAVRVFDVKRAEAATQKEAAEMRVILTDAGVIES